MKWSWSYIESKLYHLLLKNLRFGRRDQVWMLNYWGILREWRIHNGPYESVWELWIMNPWEEDDSQLTFESVYPDQDLQLKIQGSRTMRSVRPLYLSAKHIVCICVWNLHAGETYTDCTHFPYLINLKVHYLDTVNIFTYSQFQIGDNQLLRQVSPVEGWFHSVKRNHLWLFR